MNLEYNIPHRPPESAALFGAADPHFGAPSPERMLMDAVERALRAPRGKLAMALHLSRLKTPPPRPYHTRIALALMQDTAQRLGGQVFPMRNADLVLLCAAPDTDDRAGKVPPPHFALPDALQRLFGGDTPDTALTSLWHLEDSPAAFRDYIAQRQSEPVHAARPHEEPGHSSGLAGLMARIEATEISTMLLQQTAVILRPGRGLAISARLSPLFRDLLLSPSALLAAGDDAALEDVFVMQHAAAALEGRVIQHVLSDLAAGGPLVRPTRLLNIPLHLNLSPDSVISPPFARLTQLARSRDITLAVQMQAMSAASDPALATFSRQLLAQAGIGLVLSGIDHAALTMTNIAALAPTLVKLSWSPRLAEAAADILAHTDAAIAAIGPERIVLHEADGEAALLWAQSRGITRFQGPFMDAVQAASRIAICHSARACTLRQCATRGLAVGQAPRIGCGNPGLLDMSAAPPNAGPAA